MDYQETKELEVNVKIKNKAEEIYKGFLKNASFTLKDFDPECKRFKLWSDSNNAEYLEIDTKRSTGLSFTFSVVT